MADYIWTHTGQIKGYAAVAGADVPDLLETLPSREIQRLLDRGYMSLKPPAMDPAELDAVTAAAAAAQADADAAAASVATKQDAATAATDAELAAAVAALGLGTAATYNVGTTSGTIALLGAGGILPIGQIGSGTPSGKKFLRDDSTLQGVSGVVHSGIGTPPAEAGITGDYWHATDLKRLYGPKGSDVAWGSLATVAFRAGKTSTGGVTTMPTGTQVGDGLILHSINYFGAASSAPAGWTNVAVDNNTNTYSATHRKVATQADIDSGVTLASGGDIRHSLTAWSNTDETSPIQVTGMTSGSTGAIVTADVATSDADTLAVHCAVGNNNSGNAPGAGVTTHTYLSYAGVAGFVASTVHTGLTTGVHQLSGGTGGQLWKTRTVVLAPRTVIAYADLSDREVTQAELDGRVEATATALPTAAVGNRGKVYVLLGGAGVADAPYICLKDAANAYAWRAVTVI